MLIDKKMISYGFIAVIVGLYLHIVQAQEPTAAPTSVSTEGIYAKNPSIGLDSTAQQIIMGVLMVSLFAGMVMELLTPEVLFMTALVISMLFQIITLEETLSGFSNQSMITIGTLYLVVGGVERSHIVDYVARKTFGSDGTIFMGKLRLMSTCFCLSIFFNNTPLVAILLPVVKDWARMRNIAASQLLIPLSYSVLAGSFITMIGTSTNLTIQGLMEADRGYSFGFFAPAPFGFPLFFLLLIYQLVAGPLLLPNASSGLIRAARDKASDLMAEIYVSEDSQAVGKSVGEMMNSLGVAPTSAIKIRRKLHYVKGESERSLDPGSEMLDWNFINKSRGESLQHASKRTPNPSLKEEKCSSPVISRQTSGKLKDLESQKPEDYIDIIAPSYHELIGAGDVVFVSSAQDLVEKMMKSIAGESKGLYILTANVLALPGFGTELVECVVSDTNPFIGQKVSEFTGPFAERYAAGLITVRGKDWEAPAPPPESSKMPVVNSSSSLVGLEMTHGLDPSAEEGSAADTELEESKNVHVETNRRSSNTEGSQEDETDGLNRDRACTMEKVTVSDHRLSYGDIILCVTNEKELATLARSRDFFVVSAVGALPKPLDWYKMIPVIIFVAMLALVASEQIRMAPAALTVTVVYFLGGWISPSDISTLVDVRLLMLIGCAISFAQAVTKSGLAVTIAETLAQAATNHQSALFLVYALTLVITELISNNAAAALMYPIAVTLADDIGADFKPFAMCVLIASTSGFMSPIGYQTHVMVWGPGGYKFRDFLLFGFAPDIIYWLGACALIPLLYPF